MTDNIRPIRIHPRTREVITEVAAGVMEIVEDENVPFDPQLMGIVMPKAVSWHDFGVVEGSPIGVDDEGDHKRIDDLYELDEFLRATPGTGDPKSTTVKWAMAVITDVLEYNRTLRESRRKLQARYLEQQHQIRKARKALKPKEES